MSANLYNSVTFLHKFNFTITITIFNTGSDNKAESCTYLEHNSSSFSIF